MKPLAFFSCFVPVALLLVMVGIYKENTDKYIAAIEASTPETITETKVEYVEIPKYIFIEERPAIEVTSGEREMLARLVYREARGESIECQRAVVSVVINRMNKNGESVKETIFAKGQFSTAGSLDRTTPTETQYEAVDYVLMHGSTLPPYVLYFSGGHPHGWAGYQVYAVIDNTYFGYMGGVK